MTDQAMNRVIAEALTALGVAEELCWEFQFPSIRARDGERPHDFSDPRYLVPALEAWRLVAARDESERMWSVFSAVGHEPAKGSVWVGEQETEGWADDPWAALRHAFAMVLGVAE